MTETTGYPSSGPWTAPVGRFLRRAAATARTAVLVAVAAIGATARPTVAHLAQHGYSVCAAGCISAAAFTHSVFTGLITLGVCFLLFEWKVSDEGDSRS